MSIMILLTESVFSFLLELLLFSPIHSHLGAHKPIHFHYDNNNVLLSSGGQVSLGLKASDFGAVLKRNLLSVV